MTAIWRHDGSGWRLLAPTGFPDETTLHRLVEEAPQILPLAGDPRLVILGREVALGTGFADLIAVEPAGRLAILEVKLARNAEARRAVVAQVLTYAAYLTGIDPTALEQDILGRHLRARNYDSLAGAAAANDQEGSFDSAAFTQTLRENLAQGRFRLVMVLDETPAELVRLVGYLEMITDRLLIDLVTVSAYTIEGSQVLVPQRVDIERKPQEPPAPLPPSPVGTNGHFVVGAADFVATIEQSQEEHRPALRRLADWALSLEREGLVKLGTYHGRGRWTLLPRLLADDVGLVTIWNDRGGSMQLWRSVFMRRAPQSLLRVEEILSPVSVGQGNSIREFGDDLLAALTQAYREAALGVVASPSTNVASVSDQ